MRYFNGRRCQQAFTLIEALMFSVALAMTLVLSAVILVATFRIEAAANETFRRETSWIALADQFRADVAASVAAPDRFDEFMADAACLILKLPDGRHVIYRWVSGQLERVERKPDDEEIRRFLPIGAGRSRVEFRRGAGPNRKVSLQLIESPSWGKERLMMEIGAALGGRFQ